MSDIRHTETTHGQNKNVRVSSGHRADTRDTVIDAPCRISRM
mgnify:CR=1 FL=1